MDAPPRWVAIGRSSEVDGASGQLHHEGEQFHRVDVLRGDVENEFRKHAKACREIELKRPSDGVRRRLDGFQELSDAEGLLQALRGTKFQQVCRELGAQIGAEHDHRDLAGTFLRF